jgi:hypothetical protein
MDEDSSKMEKRKKKRKERKLFASQKISRRSYFVLLWD